MDLLKFIVTTTYFSFRGVIYQQKFGAAMGSPVSSLLSKLFMEWLEKQAIATAPVECKLKLWKRYVPCGRCIGINKEGASEELTDHINSVDPTGNIKFTYEEEEDKHIPFLDTFLVRREDGSVKLLVYRKKTHTDQYLNFRSHHPLNHKLAVIRTLLERCYSIVSEEDDRKKEENFAMSLNICGYPSWTIAKVKWDIVEKSRKGKSKKGSDQRGKHKGFVVVPYLEGLREAYMRILKSHSIATANRPQRTLRNIFVHPKDKVKDEEKTELIYLIPCKNCASSYIGETDRKLGLRMKEH